MRSWGPDSNPVQSVFGHGPHATHPHSKPCRAEWLGLRLGRPPFHRLGEPEGLPADLPSPGSSLRWKSWLCPSALQPRPGAHRFLLSGAFKKGDVCCKPCPSMRETLISSSAQLSPSTTPRPLQPPEPQPCSVPRRQRAPRRMRAASRQLRER